MEIKDFLFFCSWDKVELEYGLFAGQLDGKLKAQLLDLPVAGQVTYPPHQLHVRVWPAKQPVSQQKPPEEACSEGAPPGGSPEDGEFHSGGLEPVQGGTPRP